MMKRINNKLILLGILLLGAFFRFYNPNWDQWQHLHPDERFLTMVGNAMKMPASLTDYFNQEISPFNPANIGYEFFVYGTFPIVLNKLLAVFFMYDDYNMFTLFGRSFSALMDLLVVFLVFKTLRLFEKKHSLDPQIKYWGAFFYAIAVLPIQLSHFFAVDTFLNFFCFAAFYTMLKFSFEGRIPYFIASAICLGFAFGSKATAIFVVPLVLFFLIDFVWKRHTRHFSLRYVKQAWVLIPLLLIAYSLLTYMTVRIADPYLFEHPDFFDPQPSKLFLKNIDQLNSWGDPSAWFPPGVQWIHKTPVIFALQNIALFGVGLPYFFLIIVGSIVWLRHHKRRDLLFIFVWMVFFFIYQSTRSSKTMRYFILMYPFLAMLAAFGFTYLTGKTKTVYKIIGVIIVLIWPLMFFSIYTQNHSRTIAASWMYHNIKAESIVLGEHWDDALPIGGSINGRHYIVELLPVFDPDTPEKWKTMDELLNKADYYILSSNRGWGSIPTVPERYPRMTKFYQDLLSSKLNYQKVAEITSYPSLRYLGIPIDFPDDFAEEAFTVYDHPKVLIYKHSK